MLILDGHATVLDCNGAALSFFRARRRSQLCDHPRLLLQELVAPSHVEPFRHKVHGLVNSRGGHRGTNNCSFEATVLTFGRVEVHACHTTSETGEVQRSRARRGLVSLQS